MTGSRNEPHPRSWRAAPIVRIGWLVTSACCLAFVSPDPTIASGRTADLTITKIDGSQTAVPGESVNYLITVSNPAGPDDALGAAVSDLFPEGLTCVWTCATAAGASCTAGPVIGDLADLADLPAGSAVVYTATCDVDASASGMLINTAAVAPPQGITDPDPSNNSATDTNTLTPLADLAVTKSDGLSAAVPGETVTYEITVTNGGPSDVVSAAVSDPFPAILTCTWTCAAGAGGSCSPGPIAGDLFDLVDLPAGAAAVFSASCLVDPGATDSLVNTVTVGVPAGTTDLNGANDAATDADVLEPMAELAIAKTDGSVTAIPGAAVTYALTVINRGPSDVIGATVADAFPAELADVAWTCAPSPGAHCASVGSGDLNDIADLPAGGTVVYSATGTVDAGATGMLSNTASVASPANVPDPALDNNQASDIDTLTPAGDLSVSKDDDRTSAVPGTEVVYTITATNLGPSDVVGATISDAFPAELIDPAWTCFGSGGASCGAASGTGDLAETADLAVGSSVRYRVSATIDPSAAGVLSNTATIVAPAGFVEIAIENNSDSDVDSLDPAADLTVSKTDGQTTALFGFPLTYTITVGNDGPGDATAAVLDSFPGLLDVGWTCAGSGGALCAASGAGSLSETITVPVGAVAVFTATGVAASDAPSPLTSTATVVPTGGITDPDSANNSDSDSTELLVGTDLAVSKDDGRATVQEGQALTYTILVANLGPGDVVDAEVADPFPAALEACSWSCVAGGSASCTASTVMGDLFDIVQIPAGAGLAYTATCAVAADAGEILNTASVTVPRGVIDLDADNDLGTDATLVVLFADGFESGDLSAWSDAVGRQPDEHVNPKADLHASTETSEITDRKLEEGVKHGLE